MLESLGTRLRQQRERQGISLATITEQTKIKQSLLEGLERDDVSYWPGGLFRRAYVRAYAHAIGLDPEVVVREFVQLYPDANEEVSPMAKLAETADRAGGPPTRLRQFLESAMRSIPGRSRDAEVESQPAVATSPLLSDESRVMPVMEDSEPLVADGSPPGTEPAPVAVELPTVAEPQASGTDTREVDEVDLGAAANLEAVANLSTAFGRAATADDLVALLDETARVLGAIGFIIWVWDERSSRLHPELAYGYSDRVLAQIPPLERDAPNATAAAFRLQQPCTVDGRDQASGALVVPVMTPAGCGGVLAIELRGSTPGRWVPALATIIASQLARWIQREAPVEVQDRQLVSER
jgi:hypothetical protein